jgi:REP element-mobilizing transposase RayT
MGFRKGVEKTMSHALVKLWIHAVFRTKDDSVVIPPNLQPILNQQITNILTEQNCKVRIVNSVKDHVHCLFLLSANASISRVIKNLKGISSHWINRENLTPSKFTWQVGYGAFSVSESGVPNVEKYIRNQERHHQKMTFQEEYDRFMAIYYPELISWGR